MFVEAPTIWRTAAKQKPLPKRRYEILCNRIPPCSGLSKRTLRLMILSLTEAEDEVSAEDEVILEIVEVAVAVGSNVKAKTTVRSLHRKLQSWRTQKTSEAGRILARPR